MITFAFLSNARKLLFIFFAGLLFGCGGSLELNIEATNSQEPNPSSQVTKHSVSWVAPTTTADGSSLTNLAGFKLYYGTASGAYTKTIVISDPFQTSYELNDFPPGVYYFAVTAFDSLGEESVHSIEVVGVI